MFDTDREMGLSRQLVTIDGYNAALVVVLM